MSRLLPAVTLPLLALLGIAVLAAGSDVLELSDSDFDYTVAEHETMLVEFFAPWCGHCQKLAPEYESAATQLKGTVPLAKVDCTVNSQTCGRFGVNGYPTLKIFRNGQEASAYDGPRSAEGIVSYMKKQAGPNSTPLHSQEGLDTFINNFDASVVGKEKYGHNKSFLTVLLTHLFTIQSKTPNRSVLLFRPPRLNSKFEENVLKFSDPISVSSLRRFIRDNIYGMCPHLTSENKDNLKNRDLVTAYYNVDYLRNPKGSNYWRNRILKVATQFQSRGLSFSVADRQEFQDDLEEDFGISPSDGAELPLITIRTREGHKYIMQEEFTRDGKALEKFLEDYFAGKLKRFLKSEPRPENNNGPVKVVVAETFEEIVNDPTKDVLIEFYAPWCGHCKNLEPKYTELGEQLADDHNIVIAKMDATANDVPSNYDVQGFPTIYFAKAGMKDSPMPYEGAREVKDLLSFLKKEATHPPILNLNKLEKKKVT
uniref:Protein disulfide-isomerase n=1 Tax=Scleropages formosus TaxID=113540 RepID=A0A8C9TJD1_SCLFO